MPMPDLADIEALRPGRRQAANRLPIVVGQSVSLFGDYIAYFTLPWLMLELTGAGTDLGLTAFAETIPVLLFGFAAGVVLDRLRILRVLIGADLVRAAVFAGLALLVAADTTEREMVFAAAFLFGSMTVVFDSGLQSLLPSVIPSGQLVDVNTTLAFARTASFAIGPAVAGLIVASSAGFEGAFAINSATFVVSALALSRVRVLRTPPRLSGRAGFLSAMNRGLRYLIHDPHLRLATAGAAVANFVFAPLEAVLVKFVNEELTVQVPSWLGWLSTDAAEVGFFLGIQAAIGSLIALTAPAVARRIGLGRMYVLGLALLGGGFAVVATMSTFGAVIPAGIAIGGVGWVNIAFVTMRQRITPETMIGRVTAASRTISYVLIPAGAVIGGAAVDRIGLVEVYLAGALLTIAVAALLILTPMWWRPVPEEPVSDWQSASLQTMGIPARYGR